MQDIHSDEFLFSIYESPSPFGIIVTDRRNKILLWNKGAETIYGYTHEEMKGKRLPTNLHQKERHPKDSVFINRSAKKNIRNTILSANRKDGTKIPVSISVSPRKRFDQTMAGYLYIVRDISKIRLQEQFRDVLLQIIHSINSTETIEEMCEAIIQNVSIFLDIEVIFICLFDYVDNAFKIVSQRGLQDGTKWHRCHFCSSTNDGLQGKQSCQKTFQEHNIQCESVSLHSISEYVQSKEILKNKNYILHIPLISDTSLLGILHLVVPKEKKDDFLQENQILNILSNEITAGIRRKCLMEEIQQYADNLEKMVKVRTEQLREKDSQLIQSGKLATLGEVATGIAHEINQPLGAISLMAEGLLMAKKRGKLDDVLLEDKLHDISKQVERINRIITHLRTFARQTDNMKQPLDIRGPLLDVFNIMGQQLLNMGIDLSIDIPEELPLILAEHTRLEQVFLNMITNAKDAIEEKETVLKSNPGPGEYANLPYHKSIALKGYTAEGFVIIEISDNGIGIPESVLEKVFDPFFTTKEVGKGTGLGLSIAYGIVQDYGGNIEITSERGNGTKFAVRFPYLKTFDNQENFEHAF